MAGHPVTIRLLDPPLHEFLPSLPDVEERLREAEAAGSADVETLEHDLARVRVLQEVNPMLGTRGVRLGILFPAIYEMQVEAIFAALVATRDRGLEVSAEIMVPLVDYRRELEILREQIVAIGERVGVERGRDYSIGTMIELPRACLRADEIAEEADFFSFGTNDLTQTALGFSRDDIEGRILGRYIEMKVFDRSPFETLDTPGVGQLVRMGAWLGRKVKDELKLGVCGEHGGDPDSIDFFHNSGIDYVSCSPYRVPVARVAAAQAAIRAGASAV
jgi:pyruvate,orthophosphate dikinase